MNNSGSQFYKITYDKVVTFIYNLKYQNILKHFQHFINSHQNIAQSQLTIQNFIGYIWGNTFNASLDEGGQIQIHIVVKPV